jgi:hypothetical protein
MTELFKSSHDALIFAFNYSSQQYAQSQMAQLMSASAGGTGTGKGLVSLDGAAQAGFILAEVGRLDVLHRACIVARYSPRFVECPCCGNREGKMAQEYFEAVATLREWSTSLFTGLSLRNVRELMVRAYYERSLKVQAISDEVKVPKRTLYDTKAKIWDGLNTLDHAALAVIDDRLRKLTSPVVEPKPQPQKKAA